jgi:DNA polymerase/3'-5' exonuclease PolX
MIQQNQSNALDYKPKPQNNTSQADEIENQIHELDKNYKLDLNKIEGVDQFDAEKLNAYIDQQMAMKMDELKQDVGQMLDAMQLEVIR